MFFNHEKDLVDCTGHVGGTECSFMQPSHKQITNYATKPLKFFCPLFPWAQGALSHTLGSSERERKGPLLEAHQMQKLGHWVPDSSQALAAIQSLYVVHFRTKLAFWSHTANASANFKGWCVGIQGSVRWPQTKRKDIYFHLYIF